MPKPQLCKLIGGASALLGIAIIIASSLLFHETTKHECYGKYESEYFQRRSEDGGVHGGYNPHRDENDNNGPYFASLKQNPSANYRVERDSSSSHYSSKVQPNLHGGGDDDDFDDIINKFDKILRYCPLASFKVTTIIGIVVGVLQIIISGLYCCANKKTVKVLSVCWSVAHACFLIALIAIVAIIFSENNPKQRKHQENDYDYGLYEKTFEKKIAFAIIALVDAVALMVLIGFVVITLKKSDYDDYSVGKTDQELISKKKVQEN